MKADVGPDRVSPLSNSRSYSSKRCATHSSQGEDDRPRDDPDGHVLELMTVPQ